MGKGDAFNRGALEGAKNIHRDFGSNLVDPFKVLLAGNRLESTNAFNRRGSVHHVPPLLPKLSPNDKHTCAQ